MFFDGLVARGTSYEAGEISIWLVREKFERVSRVAEQEEIVWSPQSQLTHPVACTPSAPSLPLSLGKNINNVL